MGQTFLSGRREQNLFSDRTRHLLMGAALATLGAAGTASATSTYIGPGGTTGAPTSGDWNTAGNWSPSGIPVGSSTLEPDFLGTGGYTTTDDLNNALLLNLLKINTSSTNLA